MGIDLDLRRGNDRQVAVNSEFAYHPPRDLADEHDRCFLCGDNLSAKTRTAEHVFPKWMLREFNLWDQRFNLPNGSWIPYRSLTIPCCKSCNSVWLSQVEDSIAKAVRLGPEAVAEFDDEVLATWLAKIYYGVRFKELAIPFDRTRPDGDTVVDKELFTIYADLHRVLQVLRGRLKITSSESHSSVYVFSTLDTELQQFRFDFIDSMLLPFAAIRLGPVGIAVSLLDWSATKQMWIPDLEIARQLALHPLQFRQVAANLVQWRARLKYSPKALIHGDVSSGDEMIVLPANAHSPDDLFEDFDPALYAGFLAAYLEQPIERVWDSESGTFWTTLERPIGTPLQLPALEIAFEPPPLRG